MKLHFHFFHPLFLVRACTFHAWSAIIPAAASLVGGLMNKKSQDSSQKKAQDAQDANMRMALDRLDSFDPYASWTRGYQAEQDNLLPNRQFAHDSALGLNRFEGYGNWDFAGENSAQELAWKNEFEPQYIERLRKNDQLLNPEAKAVRDQLYGSVGYHDSPEAAGRHRLALFDEIYGGGAGGAGGGGGGGGVPDYLSGMRTVGSGPQLEMLGGSPGLDRFTGNTPKYGQYEGGPANIQSDTGARPEYGVMDGQYEAQQFTGDMPEYRTLDRSANIQDHTSALPQYQRMHGDYQMSTDTGALPEYLRGNYTDGGTSQTRDLYQQMILDELQRGGRLTNEKLDSVQQGVRAGQAARGNFLSPASIYEEAMQTGNAAEAQRAASQAKAMQYLQSGQTVQDTQDRLRQEGNALSSQDMAARQQQLGFNNQATAQQHGIDMANTGFNNQADRQQFLDELQRTDFNNQADVQRLSTEMGRLGFNNQVGQQGFQDNMQRIQANNAAISQQFGMDLSQLQFNNETEAAQFTDRLRQLDFNNQAEVQKLTTELQRLGFNNETDARQFADQLAKIDLNNAATVNQFGMAVQKVATNNNALNAMFANRVTGAGFDNNVLQTQQGAANAKASRASSAASADAARRWSTFLQGEDTDYARKMQLANMPGMVSQYSASGGGATANPHGGMNPNTAGAFMTADQQRAMAGVGVIGGQTNIPGQFANQGNPWAQGVGQAAGYLPQIIQSFNSPKPTTANNAWDQSSVKTGEFNLPEAPKRTW